MDVLCPAVTEIIVMAITFLCFIGKLVMNSNFSCLPHCLPSLSDGVIARERAQMQMPSMLLEKKAKLILAAGLVDWGIYRMEGEGNTRKIF